MSPSRPRADLFRYRLPLTAPLVMPSGTYAERTGVLLRLTDAAGREGWGEAAPLPGYSPDTLDSALVWLRRWASGAPTDLAVGSVTPLPPRYAAAPPSADEPAFVSKTPSAEDVSAAAARFGIPSDSPSARWAVMQAETALAAAEHGIDLAQAYAVGARPGVPPRRSVATRPTVALNALLLGDADAVIHAAVQARADGYQAAKLKVGRGTIEDDAALARAVARALGPAALRLDANGAWALDEAQAFAHALGDTAVEYVEEPLAATAGLGELARRVPGIRWALDESLASAFSTPDLPSALGAAVVKPMQAWAVLTLARAELDRGLFTPRPAERRGPVVISSVFESGVGMRHLIALAAGGDAAAGLDTYACLANDVLTRRLPIGGPEVDVAAVLAPNPVDLDRLEPLPL